MAIIFPTRSLLLVLSFLFATGPFLRAQAGPSPNLDWAETRKQQPAGLELKLTLPKDHFYQGEVVDASLLFANSSPAAYHLWIGTGDRSGRIPDIAFIAQDSAGQRVPDPLTWFLIMGGMGGGLGGSQDLGQWTINLPINQWLQFEKAGRYTVFAWSNRVKNGEERKTRGEPESSVALVSDKIEITIDPRSAATEQEVIAEAKSKVAAKGDGASPAVTQLRYLGTPAARAELIPLLSNQATQWEAFFGLCQAPDLTVEAAHILTAVSQGTLPFGDHVAYFYSRLKTGEAAKQLLSDYMTLQQKGVPPSPQVQSKMTFQDSNDLIAINAIKVLQLHADPSYIDPTLAALDRISTAIDKGEKAPDRLLRGQLRGVVNDLLASKNWHFSADQEARARAIAK